MLITKITFIYKSKMTGMRFSLEIYMSVMFEIYSDTNYEYDINFERCLPYAY